MFTKLSIPVYQYTQKPILYHDIECIYRYFDISIRIAHHYKPHLHTHTDPVCPDTTLLQLLCFSDVALFYLKNVVAIKSVVQ